MTANRLYHFTCSHAIAGIRRVGALLPLIEWRDLDRVRQREGYCPSGLAGAPAVVWLTHEPRPNRDAVGLTSHSLDCDRMEWRCEVLRNGAVRWTEFATRHGATPEFLANLCEDDADPALWWVVTRPTLVRRIVRYAGVLVAPDPEAA